MSDMGHSVENVAGRPMSFLRFDGMTWPNPADPAEVQWRLRYGQPSKADLIVAASFMHAYAHLIDLPQRERNERVRQIRARVTPPAECDGCLCPTEHDGDYGSSGHAGPCPPHTCVLPPAEGDA